MIDISDEERERLERIQDEIGERIKELDKELFTIKLYQAIISIKRFFLTIWKSIIN